MSTCSELEDSEAESCGADVGTLGPLSFPGQMISVNVGGGENFCLHKDVLTAHSMYFTAALDGSFSEAQTNSISLDDVSAKDFGLYVSVMYPMALYQSDYMNLQDIWPLGTLSEPLHHPWPRTSRLWQLADRFLNDHVREIADQELNTNLRGYSVGKWQTMYERRSEESLRALMLGLQDAFLLCLDYGQSFRQSFVTAASNAPPQVFAACVDDLDDDTFRSEVTKAFALRFADPASTAKKRKRVEKWEKEKKKKQKMEE